MIKGNQVTSPVTWRPTLHRVPAADLVGITEAARILGISVQRTDTLSKDDPGFPKPASEGVRGRKRWRLWRRSDLVRYGKATGRL
jgi:hypothetical protein